MLNTYKWLLLNHRRYILPSLCNCWYGSTSLNHLKLQNISVKKQALEIQFLIKFDWRRSFVTKSSKYYSRLIEKQPPQVLYNFSIFTKHLCRSLFLVKLHSALLKETPTMVFSCEYCEIFKSTHYEGHSVNDCFRRFSICNVDFLWPLHIFKSEKSIIFLIT